MSLTLTSAPAIYPIEVADLKAQCRISTSDEDAFLTQCIAAATEYLEGFLGRQLISATYVLRQGCFADPIYLPRAPLSSVTSVQYVDTAGVTQTLSTDVYTADTYSQPGQIRRKYGQVWPQHREQDDAIVVTFVAGYGTAKTSVPAVLRQGVQVIAAYMYEHREHVVTGTITSELPTHVIDWMWQWRLVGFA